MTSGRLVALLLLVAAVAMGGTLYYFQVHAFYERTEGGTLALTPLGAGAPVPVAARDLSAIDAETSPLRYRACFAHDLDPGAFEPHPRPQPTVGPGWFGCYDAGETARAIAAGEAAAVVAEANVVYGVDRVAGLWPDGRGVLWHQLNPCGESVFAGREAPPGCPPPPERYAPTVFLE